MQKPSRSADDKARVFSLRSLNLLDSEKDERFDRLTRLAASIFEVPIATVSLVDENRQWFKSCYGMSTTETERDISFCGHAILGDDVFVIEDTHQDPRFVDNPLVVGQPYIRFYAGYPIKYSDNVKLGTICLLDTRPRHFKQRERQILHDLAKLVEHEIHATQLATIDELTEIYNRRGFFASASQSLNLCGRQALPVSLVFFDLNKFKQINDRFGHAQGDEVLREFAQLLTLVCRQADISARIGGDEFVLLLPDATATQVEKILARFEALVRQSNNEDSREHTIAYSYGVVHFDEDRHQSLDDLLVEGDKIMYKRKQNAASKA